MSVTMWIVSIFFTFLFVMLTFRFISGGLSKFEAIVWFVSMIVVAISCGMYFGDLDERFLGENVMGDPSSIVRQVSDEWSKIQWPEWVQTHFMQK